MLGANDLFSAAHARTLSGREADAPDQLGVSRIGPQRVEHRVHFQERQDLRMLCVGAFEPGECGAMIVEAYISDRDLGGQRSPD